MNSKALRRAGIACLPVLFALSVAAGDPPKPPAATPPASGDASGGIGGFFKSVKDAVGVGAPAPVHLLDNRQLDANFYVWIKKSGTYVDPEKVFSIKDGELRVSGKREGYLATKSQFSDFRLVAEYKWGSAKWYPRENKPRNSGIIFAAIGEDKAWMKGVECQIAEGDSGSVVLHGGAQMTVGREAKSKAWAEFPRTTGTNEVENAHGQWNALEVTCEGGHLRVRVNGQVTNEGFGVSPNAGKILLQSNGAEIFFRKLDVFPLNANSVTGPVAK